MVVDSMVLTHEERKPVISFFDNFRVFVNEGKAFKTSNASWSFTQNNPELGFTSAHNTDLNRTFHFPYLKFSNTDLVYRNARDSSVIQGTSGQLNLSSRVFLAKGGKITWGKMGLDPNGVYCEADDYLLNLNYSNIKIDTVVFHYQGLLNKPLKGSFEDNNKGYGDINKANFPYFRSYEGGVVIENFIPNVRYEGGFSLRGIRKIGSAYYEWVDKPEDTLSKPGSTDDPDNPLDDEPFDPSLYMLDEDAMEDVDPSMWEEEEDSTASGEEVEESIFGPDFDPAFANKEYKLFKAQMIVLRNGVPSIRLKAMEFVLDLKNLVSEKTEVTVYVDKDSIWHPSLKAIYMVEKEELVAMKVVDDCFSRQPFWSPYHNFNFYFDALRYHQGADTIFFTAVIDKKNELGALESTDFFKKQRFDQFKGVLPMNPIGAIYRYMHLQPGVEIYPEDILRHPDYKLSEKEWLDAFIFALRDLECSGFIDFNDQTHQIIPKEKLTLWASAARERKDYDAIQILSEVDVGNNGGLSTFTKDVKMYGVAFFSLSDSQFVRVKPTNQQIVVGKNRDITFGGTVAAGKLNFYGEDKDNFKFEYENFKVRCDSLDSLRFILVRETDPNFVFSPLQKALRATVIEGVTGAIYINKTHNKSGKERFAEYSIFDSYTNSYVYWAKNDINGGIYTKDRLYFSIDPFVLDSLETFNERTIEFEGEFYSSEIFPRFRQKLAVMEDFTLGLKQITPPDTGYAVYENKGRYKGEISLDGSGLYGAGQMEFLNTTAVSDSFSYAFDSVKAVTKQFYMPGGERDGAYFPEIKAEQVKYKWLTKKDEIELESDEKSPIVMFGGEGTFVGKMRITKEGLKGSGTITMGNVSVTSDNLTFNEKDFDALNGTFKVVNPLKPSEELFVSKEVDVKYDVAKHHSTFVAREVGEPNSSFPTQQWKSSLGSGEYDRAKNDIWLESRSAKMMDNYFYSSDPAQDSLNFYAGKAHYNLGEQRIEIESVPFIKVADATVSPDSNYVEIKQSGMMAKLKNAVVEADTLTSYHKLYNADIEIKSRTDYAGKGKYDYIPIDGKSQYVNLAEIGVNHRDTSHITIAKGVIPEEQKFYITDRIFFRGEMSLSANTKRLHFKGEVLIDVDNPIFKGNWIPFDKSVHPDTVIVPIDPQLIASKGLAVGLHFVALNRTFYSTFLMAKKDKKDLDVVTSKGGLTFDRTLQEFRIGEEAKLAGEKLSSPTSSYNDKAELITTRGLIEFPTKFAAKEMEFQMAGMWKDEIKAKNITTDMVVRMKLDAVPAEAWAKLAERYKLLMPNNDDIDFRNRLLQESVSEFLDKKEDEKAAKAFVQQVDKSVIYTDVTVAKQVPNTSLLLSGVKFRYSRDYRSLYASGEVGIIGINGEPINKMTNTNTKIEFNIGKTSPNGVRFNDTLRVYLEIAEGEWLYLQILDQEIRTACSDVEGYIGALNKANEKSKGPKTEGYRFTIMSEADKEDFLSRFTSRYIWNLGGGGGGAEEEEDTLNGGGGAPPPGDDKSGGEGGPLDDGMGDPPGGDPPAEDPSGGGTPPPGGAVPSTPPPGGGDDEEDGGGGNP
jgi:hypothetical protein